MTRVRLGTRPSVLATTQSRWVARRLAERGVEVDLVPVTTEGDRSRAPLTEIGGTGVFVAALRAALLAGEVDLAVHSLKDLPTAPAADLEVVAVPEREDPRDVVVTGSGRVLAELPDGALVGTGAPRRVVQLRALAPQVRVVDIRGNVDTRIGKVASGRVDAVVLAAAGLARLGRSAEVTQTLDPEQMLPAPGQGALAVECRRDHPLRAVLAALDDPGTRRCVTAERALLARLEAGCSAPVGALARPDREGLVLSGLLAQESSLLRLSLRGSDPAGLGQALADALLDRLAQVRPTGHRDPPTRTRTPVPTPTTTPFPERDQ